MQDRSSLDEFVAVGIHVVVVPDGFRTEGGKRFARLSLSIAPDPDYRGTDAIDLLDWPKEIARRIDSLRVRSRRIGAKTSGKLMESLVVCSPIGFEKEATELWLRLLRGQNGVRRLRESLRRTPGDPHVPKGVRQFPGSYHTAMLEHLLDDLTGFVELWQTATRNRNLHPQPWNWTRVGIWEWIRTLFGIEIEDLVDALKDRVDSARRDFDPLSDLSSDEEVERRLPLLAQVSEHLAVAMGQGLNRVWAAEDIPTVALTEWRREYRRFEELWAPNEQKAASNSLDSDNARRIFLGLQSHIGLAKFLGLAVDVEVDWDEVETSVAGERRYGSITAEFQSCRSSKTWTAFAANLGGDIPYFGPCPEHQVGDTRIAASAETIDGILNLQQRLGNGGPRFRLVTMDETKLMMDLATYARNTIRSDRAGLLRSANTGRLPSVRGRGIALIDQKAAAHQFQQDENDSAKSSSAGEATLYAEDLIVGYRLDASIQGLRRTGVPQPDRWRPLMGRSVEYGDVSTAFLSRLNEGRLREQEDGHLRRMVAEKTSSGEVGEFVQEDLATWQGGSLGINSPSDDSERFVTPGDGNLATRIRMDLPKDSARRPLPLRDGRGYYFGARLCYLNGCGLPTEDAFERYAKGETVLGNDFGDAFTFCRREAIQAPDVLLSEDSPLVRGKVGISSPGETIDRLVVRSGEGGKFCRRFLVPPRVSFDLAEQAGVFDSCEEETPPGAFENLLWLSPARGAFPEARNGHWEPPVEDASSGSNLDSSRAESRGTVLVFDQKAPVPIERFYPDPYGRKAGLAFLRGGVISNSFGRRAEVEFWEGDKDYSTALPVLLELRPGRGGKKKGRFVSSDGYERITTARYQRGITLRKVAVDLDPGEIVELHLWSVPDRKDLSRLHSFLNLRRVAYKVNSVSTLGRDHFVSGLLQGDQINRLVDEGLLESLSTRKILTLVHAVKRPIRPPRLVRDTNTGVSFGLVAVPAGEGETGWRDFVRAQESLPVYRRWQSVAGGTTAYIVGSVQIDRQSTAKLRCEAAWYDHQCSAIRKQTDGRWAWQPLRKPEILFGIEQIPFGDEDRGLAVDFLRDRAQRLRFLSYPFPDGRARRLRVRIVGTSRFTDYFRSNDQASDKAIRDRGEFELGSADTVDQGVEMWFPATFRASAPKIDRIVPAFKWKSPTDITARELHWKRESMLRIYHGGREPNPWPISGEGEQLAVVVWPGDLSSSDPNAQAQAVARAVRSTVCSLETDVNSAFLPYISRWGADPIHVSGDLPDLLGMERFSNATSKRSELLLPLYEDQGTSNSDPMLRVGIAAYSPSFDSSEGQWYSDVAIDSGPSYFPFVQLGLARYQAHAVAEHELSPPTRAFAQIPPAREVMVSFRSSYDLTLRVSGVGYHASHAREGAHDSFRSDRPVLNVRLMRSCVEERAGEQLGGWRPVLGLDRRPIEWKELRPTSVSGQMVWELDLKLPNSRNRERYGLHIEEYELLPRDCKEGLSSDGGRQLLPRGPFFSHVLELGGA